MKNLIFISVFAAFLTSCMEAPSRYRTPTNPLTTPGNGTGFGNPIIPPGETGGTTTGGTTGTGGTTTAGYESCDLSYKRYTVDIGHFGLCQNKYDPTAFRVKFSLVSSVKVCLIPTFKDSNGSSTYVGEPQCLLVSESGKVMEGILLNNRPGYENKPINGVMVMKFPLLPGYIGCMHAFINWPASACSKGAQTNPSCQAFYSQCPSGAGTSQACYNEATNHKNSVCTDFKNRYSDSYSDIRLY